MIHEQCHPARTGPERGVTRGRGDEWEGCNAPPGFLCWFASKGDIFKELHRTGHFVVAVVGLGDADAEGVWTAERETRPEAAPGAQSHGLPCGAVYHVGDPPLRQGPRRPHVHRSSLPHLHEDSPSGGGVLERRAHDQRVLHETQAEPEPTVRRTAAASHQDGLGAKTLHVRSVALQHRRENRSGVQPHLPSPLVLVVAHRCRRADRKEVPGTARRDRVAELSQRLGPRQGALKCLVLVEVHPPHRHTALIPEPGCPDHQHWGLALPAQHRKPLPEPLITRGALNDKVRLLARLHAPSSPAGLRK
eukprot:Hpha_TRINITY_DN15571_c2_g14::TRINITY_DN15571_c2_g14_i1::g.106279::m.106279